MSDLFTKMTLSENATDLSQQLAVLWAEQLTEWPMLGKNSEALLQSQAKKVDIGPYEIVAQCNPGRAVSTGASIDPKKIAARPCFLCDANRPPEQRFLPFCDDWIILCNPAPILAPHYTIVSRKHQPQAFSESFDAVLRLSQQLSDSFTVFYNGPKSGASAPDHLHVQAVPAGLMPVEATLTREVNNGIASSAWLEHLSGDGGDLLLGSRDDSPAMIAMVSDSAASLKAMLEQVMAAVPQVEPEPRLNFYSIYTSGRWVCWLSVRAEHRPRIYGHEPQDYMISPGSIDMAGVMVVPRANDFERLNAEVIHQVYRDVVVSPEIFAEIKSKLASG